MRKVVVLAVSLMVLVVFAGALAEPSAIADGSQQSALIGQWKAAAADDSSSLIFLSDGRWGLADDDPIAGTYEWTDVDSITLSYMSKGEPMVMVWRVHVADGVLQVVEDPGQPRAVVKWLRVNGSSGTAPTPPKPSAPPATKNATNTSPRASIRFEGAVIGLVKVPGSTWDLDLKLSKDDIARFQGAALKAAAKGAAALDPMVAAQA